MTYKEGPMEHKDFMNTVFAEHEATVTVTNVKKKDQYYDSHIFDDMKKQEDKHNKCLYQAFDTVNVVLRDNKYNEIQSITPAMDVKNNQVVIVGTTKHDPKENRGLFHDFVKDFQEAVKGKGLKFEYEITDPFDTEDMNGYKKTQLVLKVKK
jgi:hypothetical protein